MVDPSHFQSRELEVYTEGIGYRSSSRRPAADMPMMMIELIKSHTPTVLSKLNKIPISLSKCRRYKCLEFQMQQLRAVTKWQ